MQIYVGLWDCKACGNKGNLGPTTTCAGCGASRPKNVEFYLPTDAAVVTDEEQLKAAQAGVDWICGHCQGHNKALEAECQSCGNPKDELSGDAELVEKEYIPPSPPPSHKKKQPQPKNRDLLSFDQPAVATEPKETPSYQEAKERISQHRSDWPPPKKVPKKRLIPIWFWVLSGIVGIGYLFYQGRPTEMTVHALTWEGVARMQHFELTQFEGWELPKGAQLMLTKEVQDGTHSVKVGTKPATRSKPVKVGNDSFVCGKIDMGNGNFRDRMCTRPKYEDRLETYQEDVYGQVPKMRTKYVYLQKDWVTKERMNFHGTQASEDVPVNNPNKGLADWRVTEMEKSYKVVYQDQNQKQYVKPIKRQEWEQLKEGETMVKKLALFSDEVMD